MFHKCRSWDHIKDKDDKFREDNYFALVGDPCYRYCREVKEVFFSNFAASYLFLKAISQCEDQLVEKYETKRQTFKQVIASLVQTAKE